MPMNMNSFEGKRILALIREGDYAHAGEEEAIERVFRAVPKQAGSWLLDVGCGRGGSAEYLRRRGWGRVEGSHHETLATSDSPGALCRPSLCAKD
jgi:hypothetical protein